MAANRANQHYDIFARLGRAVDSCFVSLHLRTREGHLQGRLSYTSRAWWAAGATKVVDQRGGSSSMGGVRVVIQLTHRHNV